MSYWRRILYSNKASDCADRMQLMMLIVMAVSQYVGANAVAVTALLFFWVAWVVEIICRAIEQRPTIVVVRAERER